MIYCYSGTSSGGAEPRTWAQNYYPRCLPAFPLTCNSILYFVSKTRQSAASLATICEVTKSYSYCGRRALMTMLQQTSTLRDRLPGCWPPPSLCCEHSKISGSGKHQTCQGDCLSPLSLCWRSWDARRSYEIFQHCRIDPSATKVVPQQSATSLILWVRF